MAAKAFDEIIPPESIEALNLSVGGAQGLPGGAYSGAFYAIEQRTVFARSWCAVAFEDEVSDPGDVRPVDLAGWSLVVVRGKDGEVRTFHNVCRHRANKVIMEPCSGLRRLTCGWHGWSYDLDGKLVLTPLLGGRNEHKHPEFDSEGLDLKPVRTAVWRGMVYVNIAGNKSDFDEHIAPLEKLVAPNNDHTDLEIGGAFQRCYPANWKVIVEGAIEDYHISWVHPEIAQGEKESNPALHHAEECFFAISTAREWEDGQQPPPSTLPKLTPKAHEEANRNYMASVFPNAFMITQRDHLLAVILFPDGHAKTRMEFRVLCKSEAVRDDKTAADRESYVNMWELVFDQDEPFMEAVQANMERPVEPNDDQAVEVRFSPFWEANVRRFQQTVVSVASR